MVFLDFLDSHNSQETDLWIKKCSKTPSCKHIVFEHSRLGDIPIILFTSQERENTTSYLKAANWEKYTLFRDLESST